MASSSPSIDYSVQTIGSADGSIAAMIKNVPIAQMITVLVRHAVERNASAIHIEPTGRESKIRFRIDGALQTVLLLPLSLHQAMVSRVKALARLQLDETRLPQDGRVQMRIENDTIDFRVSTFPLLDQEKAVLCIVATMDTVPTLAALGFRDHSISVIEHAMRTSRGLFLVTGPAGSGKTMTLYTLLAMCHEDAVSIATIEDPIECVLPGINQSQVRPEIGFTFASGLRALLRHDTDVIMVGEIRDTETGELALHAGLTGRLVFSTLHTRNAVDAIPRLRALQLEPLLLASAVKIVIAQRLVRTICSYCKEHVTLPSDLEKQVRDSLKEIPKSAFPFTVDVTHPRALLFFRGKGCARCEQTGYSGRTIIAEIRAHEDGMDLVTRRRTGALLTIRHDGLCKALEGITTVEEVLRATQE